MTRDQKEATEDRATGRGQAVKIRIEGDRITFRCPGCGDTHAIRIGTWSFNGDAERPTFSPSVLATSGHYCEGHGQDSCWCTYEERYGKDAPFSCYRCHSFVTDGRIQFLSDCTHALAGQTVDLPDMDQPQ